MTNTSPAGRQQEARSMLQLKEQELYRLREEAFTELEQRLKAKEEDFNSLNDKFKQLRADFEYNLQLLKDRDDELQQYEQNAAVQQASLADKDKQLSELQVSYDEAYTALRSERAARSEEAVAYQAKLLDLHRQLEEDRLAAVATQRRLTEQHDATKRSLQRALAETHEALARQQRELAAAFDLQAQQLEAKYSQQAEDARQEAAVAKTLAEQRADEAKAAHTREQGQLKAVEAAMLESRRHEQAAKALAFELDSTRKLKDDALAELQTQNTHLKHQLKIWSEEADAQRAALTQQLEAALTELEDLKSSSTASASLTAAQHEQEVALLRQRLEQAQSSVSSLGDEVRELRSSVKAASREQQDKIAALEQARRVEREQASESLTEAERAHAKELRAVQEQLWARDEEVKVLRNKLSNLKQALAKSGADIRAFKDQLVAAGETERELHRRVVTAELRLEEVGAPGQGDSHGSHQVQVVTSLLEQRDMANTALQEAQSRLLGKELELQNLRETMKALMSPSKAATAATPLAASSRLGPSIGPVGARVAVQVPATAAHMPDVVTSPRGGLAARAARPSPLQLPAALSSMLGKDLQGSPMELILPSPLLDSGLPGSPYSRPAGSARQAGAGAAAAGALVAVASAAAARAAEYLRSSKDELDGLIMPQPLPREGEGAQAQQPQQPPTTLAGDSGPTAAPMSPHEAALHVALQQAEAQNHALRASLAVMRAEMEALQHAAASAAAAAAVSAQVSMGSTEVQALGQGETAAQTATSFQHAGVLQQQAGLQVAAEAGTALDVELLVTELQASDQELQHQLQHLHILQQQVNVLHSTASMQQTPHGTDGNGAQPAAHSMQSLVRTTKPEGPNAQTGTHSASPDLELQYLRDRVEQLVIESRQLRRQLLQARLASQQHQQSQTQMLTQSQTQSQGSGQPVSMQHPQSTSAAAPAAAPTAGPYSTVQVPLGPVSQADVERSVPEDGAAKKSQQQGGAAGGPETNDQERKAQDGGSNTPQPAQPINSTGSDALKAPSGTIACAASAGPVSSAEDNASEGGVEDQLIEAQQRVQQLQQENEQLMEMSNALRAERDHLAARLVAAGLADGMRLDLLRSIQPLPPPVLAPAGAPAYWGYGPPQTGADNLMTGPHAMYHAIVPQFQELEDVYEVQTYEAQWQSGRDMSPVRDQHTRQYSSRSPTHKSMGPHPYQTLHQGTTSMPRSGTYSPPAGSPTRRQSLSPISPVSARDVHSPRASISPGPSHQPLNWVHDPQASSVMGSLSSTAQLGSQPVRLSTGRAGNSMQPVIQPGTQHDAPVKRLPEVIGTALHAPSVAPALPGRSHAHSATTVLLPPAGATATSALQGFVLHPAGQVPQHGNAPTGGAGAAGGSTTQQQQLEAGVGQVSSVNQGDGMGSDPGGQGGDSPGDAGSIAMSATTRSGGYMSARETASQRAKLRALQQRRERNQQGTNAVVVSDGIGTQLRVRNWNIKDDEEVGKP